MPADHREMILVAIEIGNEAIVVGHAQDRLVEGRRVFDREDLAQVDREIARVLTGLPHVVEDGGIVVVAVADAGGAFEPAFGGVWSIDAYGYNNGRFTSEPGEQPAGDLPIMSFGTGTGAFVSC